MSLNVPVDSMTLSGDSERSGSKLCFIHLVVIIMWKSEINTNKGEV